MTDIELLKAAAKAAGYQPLHMEDEKLYLFGIQEGWNPLADDGDALRLAVKLDLHIFPGEVTAGATWDTEDTTGGASERHGNDKHAAVRRAIVRAAAAIGEQMK